MSAPPPYGGDTELCKTLSPETLDATFWYPGPQNLRQTPHKHARARWDQAKNFCLDCPFFLSCRENTLGEEYGVWGGRDQHERYWERRKLNRQVRRMSAEDRAALAARLHRMHSPHRGVTVAALSRRTGYSESAIKALLEEHEKAQPAAERRQMGVLTEQERALLASMQAKGRTMRYMSTSLGRSPKLLRSELAALSQTAAEPTWPEGLPPGDGWVWHHGVARSATYLGQTVDGQWVRMALRSSSAPTRRWFIADHVQMRRPIAVQILEWAGRESREQRVA